MNAEVGSRSTPCKTIEDASIVHNPTIQREADELAKTSGKKTLRTICATYWVDSTEERDNEFERVCAVWPSCKYILYGPVEFTEENKKPHCHCLIVFANSKQWKTIIKTLPSSRYHLEKCYNFTAQREYALKNDPNGGKEYGTPLKQGARTDISKLMEKCDYDVKLIRQTDPALYSRYRNGIKEVCEDHQHDNELLEFLNLTRVDDEIVDDVYIPADVHWYYGPTGCGKTLTIKNIIKEQVKNGTLNVENISVIHKMENGFAIGNIARKTDVLLLDEFRGSNMKYNDLLALIDGCSINIKGGKAWIKAKHIYITSCYSPEQCYHNLNETDSIDQLLRRIHVHQMDYTYEEI